MPQCSPVGKIRRTSVEEARAPNVSWWYTVTTIPTKSNSSTTLQTGNMRAYASDGSQCIHMDAVIHVPPEINTNFLQVFQLTKDMLQSLFTRVLVEFLAW